MSRLLRPRFAVAALALAAILIPSGTGAAAARPAAAHKAGLETVSFETGFMPDVLFTPYYVAQDLGYYAKQGLNVNIDYDKVPNLPQAVASGQYTFASAGGDAAAIGSSTGAGIQYVMSQYTQYPVGAMWLKNGGPTINKPADLKGLNIGISAPGSSTDIGLQALLHSAGLTENDVKLTAIGFTETEALINHQIDVAMTFTDNEPVQAAALGYPVNVMKVSNFVKLVSTGVITGTNLAKSNPKLVEGFVKATLEGEAYTLEHPDAAFAIALKRMPELDAADQAIQRKVLSARLAYQQPVKGHPLGWTNPAAWPTTVKFLSQIGLIKSNPPAPSSLYTNQFINQANVQLTK